MRKLSKSTTIVASVIICLVLVIGFLFTYVPMTFGSKTLVSFLGSINVSSDLAGGMYGEYDITTKDATEEELTRSMAKIQEVFESDGYKNVNVYAIGNKKIRVEVGYPRGSKTYSDVYSALSVISSGKFSLTSSNQSSSGSGSGSTTEVITVDGAECVSEVKVFTNNSVNYISIIFNDYGKTQYEALCKKTSTIYLNLGTYNQSISASNVQDYSSFTLSDSDYANLMGLKRRVVIGCMDIEVNSSTAVINTMSASSGGLGSVSTMEESGFNTSSTLILLLAALAIIMVVGIAVFAIKFGLFAVVVAISLLLNSYLVLIGINLMPSIEIGLSSIFAIALGMVIAYTFTYIYASKVKSEYEIGKSFSASLDSATKKTIMKTIIANVSLFIASLVLCGFTFSQISSATVIFAICVFLGILTNILIIPLLVKIGISFDKIGLKLFKLKKRAIGFESEETAEAENTKESE